MIFLCRLLLALLRLRFDRQRRDPRTNWWAKCHFSCLFPVRPRFGSARVSREVSSSHTKRQYLWVHRFCGHLLRVGQSFPYWHRQVFCRRPARHQCAGICVWRGTIVQSVRWAESHRSHCWHTWLRQGLCRAGSPPPTLSCLWGRSISPASKWPGSLPSPTHDTSQEHIYAPLKMSTFTILILAFNWSIRFTMVVVMMCFLFSL